MAKGLSRPLSPMEYGFWFMDQAARTHFLIMAEMASGAAPEALVAAAGYARRRHPALRCRIAIAPGKQVGFETVEAPIPVKEGPPLEDHDALVRLLEEEISLPIDTESGPLCRIRWARRDRGWVVIVALHHSIADGTCGARLMLDLLSDVEASRNGRTPNASVVRAPAPMEDHFPKRFRGAGVLFRGALAMLGGFFSTSVTKTFDFPPLDSITPARDREQKFILERIDPEIASGLARRAKEEGTTVHGALSAAQLLTFAREIPGVGTPIIPQVSLVDLRRRFSAAVDPRAMGVNMSAVKSAHPLGPGDDFWPLARAVNREVKRKLAAGFHFSYWPAMMRMIRATRHLTSLDAEGAARALDQGGWIEPPASIVSNIGRLPSRPEHFALGVENLSFLISLSGSGFFSCSASGFGGSLSLNFTHASPSISAERAGRLAGGTCNRLVEAVRGR